MSHEGTRTGTDPCPTTAVHVPTGEESRDSVERVLESFLERRRRGESPAIEELAGGRPDVARRVRAVLSTLLMMEDAAEETLPSEFPRQLGDYRLIREIGRGGMGTVFLAEQVSLRRRVALKVMTRARLDDSTQVERFRREATMASRLQHPNICTVLAAGVESGVPYIAMSFVEGESLASFIARQRHDPAQDREDTTFVDLSTGDGAGSPTPAAAPSSSGGPRRREEIARVLEFTEKSARALHAAHECGIVHRDVKPGNIMITDSGEPMLLDFGLARDLEDDEPTLTETGDVFGTPAYMSPEQMKGLPTDRRTDVYSLGVTLYETLTLRRPFEAPTRHALYDAVVKSSAPDPRGFNPEVPADLWVVIQTALEKDPNRRYRTAEALAEDLRRIRESRPILARPAPWHFKLRRWVRRQPAVAGLLLTLFTAVPAIAVFLTYTITTWEDAREGEKARRRKTMEEHLHFGFVHLDDEQYDRAIQCFAEARNYEDGGSEALIGQAWALIRHGRPDAALRLIETQGDSQTTGVRVMRVSALTALGRNDEARRLRRALPPPRTSMDYFLAGIEAMNRGMAAKDGKKDLREAYRCFTESVLRSQPVRAIYHYERLRAAAHLGDAAAVKHDGGIVESLFADKRLTWYWLGRTRLVVDDVEGSIAALKRCIAIDPKWGRAHARLSDALRKAKRSEESLAAARRAVALNDGNALIWLAMGNAHHGVGDYAAAEEAFRRSVALDASLTNARVNLADSLRRMHRMPEALDAVTQAVARDPSHHIAGYLLGIVRYMSGNLEGAAEAWKTFLSYHPGHGDAHHALARYHALTKNPHEAAKELQAAVDIRPDDAEFRYALASVLNELGKTTEAIGHLEHGTTCDPGHADALVLLGLLYINTKTYEKAIATLEAAEKAGARKPGWNEPVARYIAECRKRIAKRDATKTGKKGS